MSRQRPFRNLRWLIAGLLFLATLINYLDRQILSVVAPVLRRELSLSNIQYAYAINAFMAAYAVMYVVAGRIIDRFHRRHVHADAVCIDALRLREGSIVRIRIWAGGGSGAASDEDRHESPTWARQAHGPIVSRATGIDEARECLQCKKGRPRKDAPFLA